MTFIISFAVAMILATVLHAGARRFVRDRLRYVDAAQKGIAPILAGILTVVVLTPVVAFLPIVGIGTALAAGLGVGSGVAAGARDIKSGAVPLISNR
ncbi:MAG: hypothetical protein ABJC26_17435 [Gemmatimonadaceae bacterium]